MQLVLILCLMLLSSGMTTLGHRESRRNAKELSTAAPVAARNRDLAFNLYRALAAAEPGSNIFFSPISISMSLAMLALGARGRTKAQILECLGLSPQDPQEEEKLHKAFQQLQLQLSQPQDGRQLLLGNTLFVSQKLGIQDTFLRDAETLYQAVALPSNFKDPQEAAKQINEYVANRTNGKIVDLIKALDHDTVLVLVNFVFFRALWQTSFNLEMTKKAFHVSEDVVVQVPMMSNEALYDYLQDPKLSCMVVAIPYQGNATALLVLPHAGSLEQVENGLKELTLQEWLKKLRKRHLQLYLPRFSVGTSYQLEKVLPKLGISDIFTSQADLGALSHQANMQVSEMVHKTVVEVTESGTEAASATGTVIMFRMANEHKLRVVFNKPFLVLIMENKTKSILFLGKVAHP
ncbi:plasma serine protease inhibitor [Tenrec ecaudatus]|uniref:plasma serine protease inhibitor n=1 Tax=Tenrec ecaudatus TaxID=94439 RepID=UPI003F5A8367